MWYMLPSTKGGAAANFLAEAERLSVTRAGADVDARWPRGARPTAEKNGQGYMSETKEATDKTLRARPPGANR